MSLAHRLGNGSDADHVPSERLMGHRLKAGLSSGRSLGGAEVVFSSDEVLNQQLNHRHTVLIFSVLCLHISLHKCLT